LVSQKLIQLFEQLKQNGTIGLLIQTVGLNKNQLLIKFINHKFAKRSQIMHIYEGSKKYKI
jgi:hypothetical protein